ncbi:kinase-like domain-containing protein [Pisolithus sp. B1]|nr:kinase-like domain-containing protein [Pisolithus sp. B1]
MDSSQDILRQFAERASRYAINLNGRVRQEENCTVSRGGNAIVYSGILRPEGTRVAIKAARGVLPSDEPAIKRVFKEIHLWSKLRHDNIASMQGITTEIDQTVSTVSPWMEKGNAYTRVQDTTIDPRPMMIDIARGLHYLHTCEAGPVFHGDLKGLNVLISDSGRALLADFGFSHLVNSSFSMTVSSKFGYTIQWAAPEVFDAVETSAAADIWSFGMTLLELFTRKPPFHPLKPTAAMLRICRRETPCRPSDEETCSRLTGPWWNVCLKCWEYEPASRPTIADVLQDVANIYGKKL